MNRSLLQAVLRRVEVQSANGPRPLGDAELLRRFADHRDEAAFSALVGRHGPLVWAVCRHLLPNEADAEDAFQATFLALVQSAGRIRTPAVGAWLHGVALRVAQMAKRSAARRRQRERKVAALEATLPVANSTWAELQTAVHEEVSQLPAPLRTALVLCDLQGKSQTDVAVQLGWKLGTLSGRLSKARRQLLERLSKRGIAAGSVVTAVVAGGAEGFAGAPPVLIAKVAALARAGVDLGSVASPTLLEFARVATEVSMTRTKLSVFAALVCGLLMVTFGSTLLPLGSAQDKNPPLQPAGPASIGSDTGTATGTPPASGGRSANAAWEYKYVIRKSNRLEDFQDTLSTHAAGGWEYVGTESLQVTDSTKKTDLGSAPILVFKRPTARRGLSGFGTGSGIGGAFGSASGPGGAGSGFGGFGGNPSVGGGAGSGFGGFGGNPLVLPGKQDPAKLKVPGQNLPAASNRDFQIVALKNASASSLAKTLQDLFKDDNPRIVAEERTNSLLIQTDTQTLDALKKLLEKLDLPSPKKTP